MSRFMCYFFLGKSIILKSADFFVYLTCGNRQDLRGQIVYFLLKYGYLKLMLFDEWLLAPC